MSGLAEALDLPFDEALDYLRQKTAVPSGTWTDIWRKANVKSFSVAGAARQALVDDFRREVITAAERGETREQWRARFDEIVRKHGWEHTGKPGWRARVIYETNLSMAYSAGRHAQMTDPATLKAYPYWQYVHSGAKHPRLQHLAWNGLVLRADDPFWSWAYPPNGWGCGCRVRVVSEGGLRRMGRKAPDKGPERVRRGWVDKATGEVKSVSEGVDPGFDYNPGRTWADIKRDRAATAIAAATAGGVATGIWRAANAAEGHNAMRAAYAPWTEGLAAGERAAISSWIRPNAAAINERLRAARDLGILKQDVEDLDAALSRARAPRDLWTWRGVRNLDFLNGVEVGGEFADLGYTATTLQRLTAKRMAPQPDGRIIEVMIPKGAKAAYIQPDVEPRARQYEMLLARGSRFRLLQRDADRIVIEVIE
jgi:hypothetical protein